MSTRLRLPANLALPTKPIADIKIGHRRRELKIDKRDELAASIRDLGVLLHPITVTPEWVLVAGLHRLEACRSLGWTDITVHVVRMDDLTRSLAELQENLVADRGTKLERAEWHAAAQEIYQAMHPETRNVNVRGGPGRGKKTSAVSAPVSQPTYADVAAERAGVAKRTIQTAVQIGKELDEETKTAVRGTKIENRKEDLLKLARAPKEERPAMVTEMLADPEPEPQPEPEEDEPSPRQRAKTAERDQQIKKLIEEGKTIKEISRIVGIATSSVSQARGRLGLFERRRPLDGLKDAARSFVLSLNIDLLRKSWGAASKQDRESLLSEWETVQSELVKVIKQLA
jgi:ParB family transcriptional regulator, chromosome partitioning protein